MPKFRQYIENTYGKLGLSHANIAIGVQSRTSAMFVERAELSSPGVKMAFTINPSEIDVRTAAKWLMK